MITFEKISLFSLQKDKSSDPKLISESDRIRMNIPPFPPRLLNTVTHTANLPPPPLQQAAPQGSLTAGAGPPRRRPLRHQSGRRGQGGTTHRVEPRPPGFGAGNGKHALCRQIFSATGGCEVILNCTRRNLINSYRI